MTPSEPRVSICAIVRNESLYLAEWINFHRSIGVTDFYLYDDDSEDATAELARSLGAHVISWTPDLQAPYVCPEECDFRSTPQITAFNHYIATNCWTASDDDYVAFIDVDEYLYHSRIPDIRTALDASRALFDRGCSAIWLPWFFFGNNGLSTPPAASYSTPRTYTRRGPLGEPRPYGLQGKILARKNRLFYFGPCGSHNAVFLSGRCYDENLRIVRGPYNVLQSATTWRLNHYYHRSDLEASRKLAQGDHNAVPGYIPDTHRMNSCNRNEVPDTRILKLPFYSQRVQACLQPSSP